MHPYPHRYQVEATGRPEGAVPVRTAGLQLDTQPPPEFDGPPGYWSPETLLVASVADCYLLSFRSVARASKLEWESLEVPVEGMLDRVEGVTRFVRFTLRPRLVLRAGQKESLARTVLDKCGRLCLITSSLLAECEVAPEIVFAPD